MQRDAAVVSVRERLEAAERAILAPYAICSADSLGRERDEPESPVRTRFQRDRDRIVHSNSFRRLRGKTQVFIAPAGDHYATRLSHVLEVSQIARTIARALQLNEDLTEAIALAHDLGHAPFGHAGQRGLDALLGGGYRHDEQSVRVVEYIERDGLGLNLSSEVIDGIRTHRKPRHSLAGISVAPSTTLEAEAVKLADAIAYINHDVDDAVRARLIGEDDLPVGPISTLGLSRSERINTSVCDIVEASLGGSTVSMSRDVLGALNQLRDFLFDTVYSHPSVRREADRGEYVVAQLFGHFELRPEALPPEYQSDARQEGVQRRIADYIAGMTDSFAIALFQDLFVPKMWPV
ncbi:MAG: deoxyguanosinetriphosphate triphosphohydrolase [Chloroflexota bacterium]|nr:deoxyguanosinetriphosphate triphosphohydrolase [Chloroflexota bacterium]